MSMSPWKLIQSTGDGSLRSSWEQSAIFISRNNQKDPETSTIVSSISKSAGSPT